MSATPQIEDAEVSRFRQYLKIKTVSGCDDPKPDYAAAVQFLHDLAEEIGLVFECFQFAPERPVVVITWAGTRSDLPSVMLNSHMDVVPVYPESWICDPFGAAKQDNGDIIARGSQDMKCVGIQYLEAVRRLKKENKQFARSIHITFLPDEEIGGHLGMKLFVKSEKFKNLNIGFCLDEGLANPTDAFTVFYGEKSPWWVKVTCTGNQGHGSRFIEDTAAEKLLKVMNSFMEYREAQKSRLENDLQLKIGDVTSVNMNILEGEKWKSNGGVGCNIVPKNLSAVFDMRVAPTEDVKEIEQMMSSWLNSAGPGCTIEYIHKSPITKPTKLDHTNPWWVAFSETCGKLGVELEPEVFPAATDGRYLREIGIPVLGFSPMNNTPILLHDHNERLNEKVFLRGIEIYVHIISVLADLIVL